VIFLNEHLSWQLLMGTILIILSLAVVNWKRAAAPVPEVQPAK
jgi:drug/metabolite transporter (DMT)-like permease